MASETSLELKLHRKLFQSRKATEAVEKRGRNEGDGYDFARFEDVMAEASEQLEKRSILIVPQVADEELRFGKSGFCVAKAVMEFEVIDTRDGGSLKLRWSGTGYDSPGDKALFKAQTGCEKYFLARLLGIPFGTDPEAEEHPSPDSERRTAEAERISRQQDRAADQPDAPAHLTPVPNPDVPADPEALDPAGGTNAA